MTAASSSPLDTIPGLGEAGTAAGFFWDPKKLKGWSRNPRTFTQEHIAEIAASMRKFGFGAPVIARSPEDPFVIAGHVRLAASDLLKLPVVPVRWMAHLTSAEAKALNIADNQLSSKSKWDEPMLEEALRGIRAEDKNLDLAVLGFSQGRIDALFADAPPPDIIEIETAEVRDEFWLSVRGPLPDQPAVLDELVQKLGTIPGLNVQCGVVKH